MEKLNSAQLKEMADSLLDGDDIEAVEIDGDLRGHLYPDDVVYLWDRCRERGVSLTLGK